MNKEKARLTDRLEQKHFLIVMERVRTRVYLPDLGHCL